jgi:hypothetical protein
MRRFLALLMEHPELLFIAVVWIAGMLGQLGKLAKKRAPSLPPSPPSNEGLDAEAVAREMRRILRQPESESERVEPTPVPVTVVKRQAPLTERRSRTPLVERPPTPVAPTTSARRLPLHAASHVGESMEQRARRQRSVLGEHGRAHELGGLGGRVHQASATREAVHRYALDDLKRAFVLAEVLGPPLAIRRDREV